MKNFVLLSITVICFFGCSTKKTTNEPLQSNTEDTSKNNTSTAVSFFPVTSFLKGQIQQFDSATITALRIITIHDKVDSEQVKKEQMESLLQTFLTPEINETNLVKYFKETKFNDQTLDAITLTYDPIAALPDSINILSWNVYVDPKNGNVAKVYIIKRVTEDGQQVIQQLTWQTGEYAEIVEILNKPDGNIEILKQEKFIWHNE